VLQWSYSGVTVVLPWCVKVVMQRCRDGVNRSECFSGAYSGVTVVWQGITRVFRWCCRVVPMMLQWCYSGVEMVSERNSREIPGVLHLCCSGDIAVLL
jgi:hypothetical protein